MIAPCSPIPVNLALAVSAPGDPEAGERPSSRMNYPIRQDRRNLYQTHLHCDSRYPLPTQRMYLSHVETHHTDKSQQALPVAHLQQQANDHMLLRLENYFLRLHACVQPPS
uniref:Uncharacterized protein n=1 Tax=Peronospora matthiolae TaxID=2874970 RepID=A0AAV1ULT2_9STRA